MHSESIKNITAAMITIQSQLEPAVKNASNPFFKSRYADLGSVWDSCRELLKQAGVAVIQTPGTPDPQHWPAVSLTTIISHGDSGEWIADTLTIPLPKSTPQDAGSAITYARRYALAAFLGIVTGDDDDGNTSSGQPQTHRKKKQADPRGAQSPAAQAEREPSWLKPDENTSTSPEEDIKNKPGKFVEIALQQIKRYSHKNAVASALKNLGYDMIPNDPGERLMAFYQLRDYAGLRDSGMDSDAAIDAVHGESKR